MAQFDTGQIGSVGTVVGAALETAGHYLQSEIIEMFSNGLAPSLGGLFFFLSILTALTIMAVGGNYKFGLWLFVGPVLFYAVTFSRVNSCGAKAQFGVRVEDQALVYNATKGMVDEERCASNPAKVSVAFMMWNEISSGIVNAFTSLLHVTKSNLERDFITKMDQYVTLMNVEVQDPILKEFTSVLLQNNCKNYFSLLGAINYSDVPKVQQIYAQKIAEHEKAVVNMANYPQLARWAVTVGMFQNMNEVQQNGIISCGELWRKAVGTYKTHAVEILARVVGVQDYSKLPPEEQERTRVQIYQKLGQKFATETQGGDIIVNNEADGLVYLVNEIAARSMLREFSKINPVLATADVNSLPFLTTDGRRLQTEQKSPVAARTLAQRLEYEGKGNYLKTMMGLPYIQGLILFFLSTLFPFFALMLVIPGRHHAILSWMGLWFWVKSWDFGFGVVRIIDELLFKLMPHGPPITDEALNNPFEAVKRVLEIDPTFSVNTYSTIMATCMAAVPVLTGMLVKKAGGQVLDAVSQGFHKFGGDHGGSSSSYIGSEIAQTSIGNFTSNLDRELMNFGPTARALSGVNESMATASATAGRASALSSVSKSASNFLAGIIGGKKDSGVLGQTIQYVGHRNPVAHTLDTFANVYKDKHQSLGAAQYELAIANKAYAVSTSDRFKTHQEKARLVGFNNHDMYTTYPGPEQLEVLKRELMPVGDRVANAAISSTWQFAAEGAGAVFMLKRALGKP